VSHVISFVNKQHFSSFFFSFFFKADQGGPVYCMADTGEWVMVAMAGGYNCNTGALFAAIDITGGIYSAA
jgi:hypothetical protein